MSDKSMVVRVPVGISVEFVRDPVENVVRVYLRDRFEAADAEGHARFGQKTDNGSVASRDLATEELAADVGHVDS